MLKIITTLLLIFTLNSQIKAQSLMDLFNAATAPTKNEAVEIPLTEKSMLGRWSYNKLAVGLAEGSSLKGAFGSAAVSQVESLLNGVSASCGITPNMFLVTFFNDNIASIELQSGSSKAKSRYKLDVKQKRLNINVGTINKVKVGTLTATVSMYKDNATLLFDAKELIAVADKIPTIAENSQYQMVKGVVSSVDGVLLGFNLSKK